jgi:ribosomal protein S2
MQKFIKTNQNNQILNKLVSDNCLSFGRSPKLNNRKITHYISGTRQKVDIFNLYEMRYLLLKVYPLIHNLFLQQRLNVKKKKKIIFEKSSDFQNTSQKLPKQFRK